MLDAYEYPAACADDIDGGARALRWTAGVVVLTAGALALLNPGAIAAWADDLTPSPSVTRIVSAAELWQDTTARIGLVAPHTDLHRLWQRAESASWFARGAARRPGAAKCAA